MMDRDVDVSLLIHLLRWITVQVMRIQCQLLPAAQTDIQPCRSERGYSTNSQTQTSSSCPPHAAGQQVLAVK